MPSTPAAEDLPASPFVLGSARPTTPSNHFALRSATSQLNLRGSPHAAASDSILHVASHGSPLAARRLPSNVSPPTMLALGLSGRPVTPSPGPFTRPSTASSTESVPDRPFSVMTDSSVTDSLPGSIASSASERADKLSPWPEACVSPRKAASDGGPLRQGSGLVSVDAQQPVPSISLQGPDALDRSLGSSIDASERSSVEVDNFDLISATTVSTCAPTKPEAQLTHCLSGRSSVVLGGACPAAASRAPALGALTLCSWELSI
jgi:hypothetical protein